jgi:hypothetical protein
MGSSFAQKLTPVRIYLFVLRREILGSSLKSDPISEFLCKSSSYSHPILIFAYYAPSKS